MAILKDTCPISSCALNAVSMVSAPLNIMEVLVKYKWLDHAQNLISHFSNIWKQGLFTDCTILCGGKKFPVHRLVLASCSEYFKEVFDNAQCCHPIIIMNDISSENLQILLNFIYQVNLIIPQRKLLAIAKEGRTLKIRGLEVLNQFVSNTSSNAKSNVSENFRLLQKSLSPVVSLTKLGDALGDFSKFSMKRKVPKEWDSEKKVRKVDDSAYVSKVKMTKSVVQEEDSLFSIPSESNDLENIFGTSDENEIDFIGFDDAHSKQDEGASSEEEERNVESILDVKHDSSIFPNSLSLKVLNQRQDGEYWDEEIVKEEEEEEILPFPLEKSLPPNDSLPTISQATVEHSPSTEATKLLEEKIEENRLTSVHVQLLKPEKSIRSQQCLNSKNKAQFTHKYVKQMIKKSQQKQDKKFNQLLRVNSSLNMKFSKVLELALRNQNPQSMIQETSSPCKKNSKTFYKYDVQNSSSESDHPRPDSNSLPSLKEETVKPTAPNTSSVICTFDMQQEKASTNIGVNGEPSIQSHIVGLDMTTLPDGGNVLKEAGGSRLVGDEVAAGETASPEPARGQLPNVEAETTQLLSSYRPSINCPTIRKHDDASTFHEVPVEAPAPVKTPLPDGGNVLRKPGLGGLVGDEGAVGSNPLDSLKEDITCFSCLKICNFSPTNWKKLFLKSEEVPHYICTTCLAMSSDGNTDQSDPVRRELFRDVDFHAAYNFFNSVSKETLEKLLIDNFECLKSILMGNVTNQRATLFFASRKRPDSSKYFDVLREENYEFLLNKMGSYFLKEIQDVCGTFDAGVISYILIPEFVKIVLSYIPNLKNSAFLENDNFKELFVYKLTLFNFNNESTNNPQEKINFQKDMCKLGDEYSSEDRASPSLPIESPDHDSFAFGQSNKNLSKYQPTQEKDESVSGLKSEGKKKYVRPRRPCIFCLRDKKPKTEYAKLYKHFMQVHKNEKDIKELSKQSVTSRCNKVMHLRKKGMKERNLQLYLKEGNNSLLHRERSNTSAKFESLKMCIKCEGFYHKRTINVHIRTCNVIKLKNKTEMAEALPVHYVFNSKSATKFEIEVLDSLSNNDISSFIKENKLLQAIGKAHFNTKYSKANKEKMNGASTRQELRAIAQLFLEFRKKLSEVTNRPNDSIKLHEMFIRNSYSNPKNEKTVNLKVLLQTIEDLSSHGSNKRVYFYWLVIRTIKKLKGIFCSNGMDDVASEFEQFRESFKLDGQCSGMFSDPFNESVFAIEHKLRRPKNLPKTEDIGKIRSYILRELENIDSFEYINCGSKKFSHLRALILTRMTFLNGQRGGETCRMTIKEFQDCKTNVLINEEFKKSIENLQEMKLIDDLKLLYIAGKGKSKVPILIPPDCMKGLNILSDFDVRDGATVSPTNKFVFAACKHRKFYVTGSSDIRRILREAGLPHITATQMCHYLSTKFAHEYMSKKNKHYVSLHFEHDKEINQNISQCPMAIQEVIRVGRVLDAIDNKLGSSLENLDKKLSEDIESNQVSDSSDQDEIDMDILPVDDMDSHLEINPSSEPSTMKIHLSEPESAVNSPILESNSPVITKIEKKGQIRTKEVVPRASWSKKESESVLSFFKDYVNDFSDLQGCKGKNPRSKEVIEFMEKNPHTLSDFSPQSRENKIKIKCFNMRKRLREEKFARSIKFESNCM